ncbi:hypothetical protein, partial [Priestia megaterium]|uniref:hypothetical protein n=1 Tax=Priestia megaterium TaxID=1404 RepID=UPI00300BD1F3
MALVALGHYETNIDPHSDIAEYLSEVNEHFEQRFVVVTETVKRGLFRKPQTVFRLYVKLGENEFQHIMSGSGSEWVTEAYLLGVLSG